MRQKITEHEGNKYIRRIYDIEYPTHSVKTDIYGIILSCNVTCPATAHAIKKLLCAGIRGKGDTLDDLKGALAAVNRAIDLEEARIEHVQQQLDPCWEVRPAMEENRVIGYQVRWSKPDKNGKFLWVGHYYPGPTLTIGWCEVAAHSHAKRFNEQKKTPWEFSAYTPNE
jgi:hypothetical protein